MAVWALLIAFAAGVIASVVIYLSENHGAYVTDRMNDGWTVDYCGHHYDDVSRTDSRFLSYTTKKNDVLVMEHRIEMLSPYRIALRLYSRLSSVRVSIVYGDGREKLIYYYGYDYNALRPGDFLGSGYHFIQLPQDCYGQTLRIMEMGSQDEALHGLPDLAITPAGHAIEVFAQERSFGTFITVFMFIAGSLLTIVSISMSLIDREFLYLTLLGLFSASGGLWCMCSMKAIELFSLDIRRNSTMEYMSLYVMLIPLMGLAVRFFKKIPPALRIAMFVSMCLNIALAIGSIVLQVTDLANVDYLLSYFHIILAFDAISLTSIAFFRWKKAAVSEKFFEGGIMAAAGFGIAYIVYFYADRWWNLDPGLFDIVIMPAAFLFMIVLILIGYITDLYARRIDDTQRTRLISLAFKDDLTGLSNRTMGERELKSLDEGHDRYLFVNLDLNFLKKVNDRYGHSAGDLYLKSFSEILSKCFSDADIISRMGGDEFMVAYRGELPDENGIRKKLLEMEKMEKTVSVSMPVKVTVDAAYGYAYSDEVEGAKSEEVYRLADQRMYGMKVRTRKGRVD